MTMPPLPQPFDRVRRRLDPMYTSLYTEAQMLAYGRAVAEAKDAEIERLLAEAKADAESWAEQADQRTKDAVQFIEERDRLRELLRAARFMWVDDHSNLANRIDAALGGKEKP